jgi:CRP-like cAMP-binding protein
MGSIPAELFDGAGIAGTILFLLSYAALQTGLIRGQGYLYASLNILAAALVLVSLWKTFNLSAAILQVCWILISLVGILRIFFLTRAIRFNAEEMALLSDKFPSLSRIAARKLFKAGEWLDAPIGTHLMREGQAHGVLVYLASGRAEIHAHGTHVGSAGPGSFLGEMTVLDGTPATADVTLADPARIFRVDADRLHQLCRRDAEFRLQLENALGREMRQKLVAANRRLKGRVPGRTAPAETGL